MSQEETKKRKREEEEEHSVSPFSPFSLLSDPDDDDHLLSPPSTPPTKKCRTVDPNSLPGLPVRMLSKIAEWLPCWQRALLRGVSLHFSRVLPPCSRFPVKSWEFAELAASLEFLTRWTRMHMSHRFFLVELGQSSLIEWASGTGRIDVLCWFVAEFGFARIRWPEDKVMKPACQNGHVAVLKFLRINLPTPKAWKEIKTSVTEEACAGGHRAVVKWAVKHGKPLTADCFESAIKNHADTDFLSWLVDTMHCPLPSPENSLWDLAFDAFINPDSAVLNWLLDRNFEMPGSFWFRGQWINFCPDLDGATVRRIEKLRPSFTDPDPACAGKTNFRRCRGSYQKWISRAELLHELIGITRAELESQLNISYFCPSMLDDPELSCFRIILERFPKNTLPLDNTAYYVDQIWCNAFSSANIQALDLLLQYKFPFFEGPGRHALTHARLFIIDGFKCSSTDRVLECLDWTERLCARKPKFTKYFGPTLCPSSESLSKILRTGSVPVLKWFMKRVNGLLDNPSFDCEDIDTMFRTVPSRRLLAFIPCLSELLPDLVRSRLVVLLRCALKHGRFDLLHLLPLAQLTIDDLLDCLTTGDLPDECKRLFSVSFSFSAVT